MGLKRTSAPAALAVTVAEAKQQVGIYDSSLDDYFTHLVNAATEAVERYTGRALITQTWRLALDDFPCRDPRSEIRLPRPPFQSVTSIAYTDSNGTAQTLSSSLYDATADLEPARIEPAYNEVWPATRNEREAVRVTYVAGYGDTAASVPESLRHAILLMVSQWFNYREPSISGTIIAQVPLSATWLMDSYRTGAWAEFYELAG